MLEQMITNIIVMAIGLLMGHGIHTHHAVNNNKNIVEMNILNYTRSDLFQEVKAFTYGAIAAELVISTAKDIKKIDKERKFKELERVSTFEKKSGSSK